MDAAGIAAGLKATRITDRTLQEAGIDTEAAQVALVELVQKFGAQIPDSTLRRELVARFFHSSSLEQLGVAIFRSWESGARDLIAAAKADEEAAADAGDDAQAP